VQHITKIIESNILTLVQPESFLNAAPSRFAGVLFIFFCAILFVGSALRTLEVLRETRRQEFGGVPSALFLAGLLFLCVTTPPNVGDGIFIQVRLIFYSIVACLLICINGGASQRRLLTIGAWLFVAPFMCFTYIQYRETAEFLQGQESELMSIGRDIERGSRIVILSYDFTPTAHDEVVRDSGFSGPIGRDAFIDKISPQKHLASIVAVESGSVILNNYEGYTTHFPLKYKHAYRGFTPRTVNDYQSSNASEWRKLIEEGADKADYIVVWGISTDGFAARLSADAELRHSFEEKFCLVRETGTISRVALFRRLGDPRHRCDE
jgi:hypothetical protein